MEVKLLDMARDGKMKLSRRVLLPKPEGMPDRPERPERRNDDRPPRRDDNRGGGDRRHRLRGDADQRLGDSCGGVGGQVVGVPGVGRRRPDTDEERVGADRPVGRLRQRAEDRLEGTAATMAIAIANGADIIRVHDVREMARVARMADAIVRPSTPEGAAP